MCKVKEAATLAGCISLSRTELFRISVLNSIRFQKWVAQSEVFLQQGTFGLYTCGYPITLSEDGGKLWGRLLKAASVSNHFECQLPMTMREEIWKQVP